jgi:DNA primase catalytic subunit
MNDKIKAILKKHFNMDLLRDYDAKDLNNAIIEICDEQKKECAKLFEYHYQKKAILNSKNIAQ